MKLTIGMIVKNEEKWLDKCLSAIRPILDNIDCELIITDTGSTDKTIEIARKYTDKVLHFDWCDDFSAARNYGLKKANGEWFMMLDADDIFRSCDNIIHFFNSGEYKKYNAATYISRNIVKSNNGETYTDILAPRMVKLHADTQYEGEIHESLNTFAPPYKNISDIADHYGYLYENEEARRRKFERNSALLLKRYEKEKDTTPMLFIQLYEAYMSVGEYNAALEYLEEGIDLAKKIDSIVLVALLFHKLSYYYTEKKYETALDIADEYFEMNKKIRPYPLSTDGEIYAVRARSLCELERYDEAIGAYKDFFNIYKDISNGKLATYDSYLISRFMCADINWLPLFNEFLGCCIKTGKYNTAESYLTSFSLRKYMLEADKIIELISREISVLEYLGYPNARKYFDKLDENGRRLFSDALLIRLYRSNKKDKIRSAVNSLKNAEIIESAELIIDFDEGRVNEQKAELLAETLVRIMNRSIEIEKVCSSELLSIDLNEFINRFASLSDNINAGGSLLTEASVVLRKTVELRNKKRYKECITEIRNALSVYTPLVGILSEYSKLVIEEYEISAKISPPQDEMTELASKVKKNIRKLIAEGNVVLVEKTLTEYIKLAPNDPEANTLVDEINKMKQGGLYAFDYRNDS